MILEGIGDQSGAVWSAIRAAWACDDKGREAAAIECRKAAIGLFEQARVGGITILDQSGAEEVVLADLYRRTLQFKRAVAVSQVGLSKDPDEIVSKVLAFEEKLALSRDAACHTISEAQQE
jgi:hypothetical protein